MVVVVVPKNARRTLQNTLRRPTNTNMATSTAAAAASIAVLFQLVLLVVVVIATANEDANHVNINDIHEQHSHLTPQQYGHGLKNARARKKNNSKKSATPGGRRRRKPGRGPPRNNGNRDDDAAKRKKKKKKNKTKLKKKKNKNKDKKKNNKNGGGGANNNNKKNEGSNQNRPSNSNSKPSSSGGGSSSSSSASQTLAILSSVSKEIDTKLFLYETPTLDKVPSTVYKSSGLAKGLEVMNTQGVAGMYFYLGDGGSRGYEYGLTNIAAFLAQSMKETIKYNACSENNWDLYGDSGYPLSNACGQLGQRYVLCGSRSLATFICCVCMCCAFARESVDGGLL